MGEMQKREASRQGKRLVQETMFRAGSKRTCSHGGFDKETPYRMDAKMRS